MGIRYDTAGLIYVDNCSLFDTGNVKTFDVNCSNLNEILNLAFTFTSKCLPGHRETQSRWGNLFDSDLDAEIRMDAEAIQEGAYTCVYRLMCTTLGQENVPNSSYTCSYHSHTYSNKERCMKQFLINVRSIKQGIQHSKH